MRGVNCRLECLDSCTHMNGALWLEMGKRLPQACVLPLFYVCHIVVNFSRFPIKEHRFKFHFLLHGYKSTCSFSSSQQHPHTPGEGAKLTSPESTRDMASRAAALLLLGLVCVHFAAGKWKCGFKFPGCLGGRFVRTSSPLSLTHSAFVLLQLKLCWTAVSPKLPNSSHFRESKATGFRMLGPAVTSTLLCKGQISKNINQSMAGHCVGSKCALF